jgi:hypothetical protein
MSTAGDNGNPPDPWSPTAGHRDIGIALFLFALLAAVYLANGDFLPSNDSTPNVYGAVGLVTGSGLEFTYSRTPWMFDWELRSPSGAVHYFSLFRADQKVAGVDARLLRAGGVLTPKDPYFLARTIRRDAKTADPIFVSLFGPGSAIAAAPILRLVSSVHGDLREKPEVLWHAAKLVAVLFAACSAGFVYLTSRRWLERAPGAILALAYGLGTAVWSSSSQMLWQHAPNSFFLAAGLWAFTAGPIRAWPAIAGLMLGAAVGCRPTSAVFVLACAASLAYRHRRAATWFILGAAPPLLAIGVWNTWYFGSPLRFGQSFAYGVQDVWTTPLLEGLAGVLFSPSRGLFVFSPFLLLAVAGAFIAWRRAEFATLRPFSLGALVVVLVHAKYFIWWGGNSYGYRIIGDLVTVLVPLVVPTWRYVTDGPFRATVFAFLVVWSVAVHGLGAFAYDLVGWDDRRAIAVELPSGTKYFFDPDEARRAASEGGGRILGEVRLSLSDRRHHGRLASIADSAIPFYVLHFHEARARRAKMVAEWIEVWRPPSRGN